MKKSVSSIEEVKRDLEKFCVYQERCYQEVERKLATYHLIPEAKDEIMLYLMQHNFLNEERFAKSFVSGKINIKKWGKKKVEYQLRTKGISNKNIEIALATIDDVSYRENLKTIALKKSALIKDKNNYNKKAKLMKHLQSKGFETELIFEVLQEILPIA